MVMSDNESKKIDADENGERVLLSIADECKDFKESDDWKINTSKQMEESREDILEQEFEKIKDIPRHQEIFQTFNGKLNHCE